jgi:hypothetical protein
VSNAPGGLDLHPEWLVGFVPAVPSSPWWMRKLLRPGYAHCWAARPIDRDGTGLWLWAEWTPERLLFGLASDALVGEACEGATEVVRWRQDLTAEGGPVRPILAMHHCVTQVGHTVGLRPRHFATPWWLRCALLAAGGSVVVRPEKSQPSPEPRPAP